LGREELLVVTTIPPINGTFPPNFQPVPPFEPGLLTFNATSNSVFGANFANFLNAPVGSSFLMKPLLQFSAGLDLPVKQSAIPPSFGFPPGLLGALFGAAPVNVPFPAGAAAAAAAPGAGAAAAGQRVAQAGNQFGFNPTMMMPQQFGFNQNMGQQPVQFGFMPNFMAQSMPMQQSQFDFNPNSMWQSQQQFQPQFGFSGMPNQFSSFGF
jgi:hypothetical protein